MGGGHFTAGKMVPSQLSGLEFALNDIDVDLPPGTKHYMLPTESSKTRVGIEEDPDDLVDLKSPKASTPSKAKKAQWSTAKSRNTAFGLLYSKPSKPFN